MSAPPRRLRIPVLLPAAIIACSWYGVPAPAGAAERSDDAVFARYARYGADVWADNPSATISGEGKACISCHTSLPYAMVEPLLPGEYPAYEQLVQNVNERVLTWEDNTPWYADAKAEEAALLGGLHKDALKEILDAPGSRGVESIFNAYILAMRDAYAKQAARADTRRAFENMWAAQLQTGSDAGSWLWIKANLVPWEVDDSDLWGASLACVAASRYPEFAPRRNLDLLHMRLREGFMAASTSLHTRAAILWCNAEAGNGLIDDSAASKVVDELLALQHANGGWAIRQLGPWGAWEGSATDCCARLEVRPDAYATGFVTLVLARSHQRAGVAPPEELQRAVTWIGRTLQDPYPAEPRINRHESAEAEFPRFRNNVYTNAGHMWAYLARTVYEDGSAPWD